MSMIIGRVTWRGPLQVIQGDIFFAGLERTAGECRLLDAILFGGFAGWRGRIIGAAPGPAFTNWATAARI